MAKKSFGRRTTYPFFWLPDLLTPWPVPSFKDFAGAVFSYFQHGTMWPQPAVWRLWKRPCFDRRDEIPLDSQPFFCSIKCFWSKSGGWRNHVCGWWASLRFDEVAPYEHLVQSSEKPKISRTIGELFKYYSLIKWNYKNVLEKLH